jgi:hypothetical protein
MVSSVPVRFGSTVKGRSPGPQRTKDLVSISAETRGWPSLRERTARHQDRCAHAWNYAAFNIRRQEIDPHTTGLHLRISKDFRNILNGPCRNADLFEGL